MTVTRIKIRKKQSKDGIVDKPSFKLGYQTGWREAEADILPKVQEALNDSHITLVKEAKEHSKTAYKLKVAEDKIKELRALNLSLQILDIPTETETTYYLGGISKANLQDIKFTSILGYAYDHREQKKNTTTQVSNDAKLARSQNPDFTNFLRKRSERERRAVRGNLWT